MWISLGFCKWERTDTGYKRMGLGAARVSPHHSSIEATCQKCPPPYLAMCQLLLLHVPVCHIAAQCPSLSLSKPEHQIKEELLGVTCAKSFYSILA